ncbi:MAG: hypothetical protein ABFD60_07925 [Bryobacteraceae bacterium]
MILVIAGNYEQYRRFVAGRGGYRYLSEPQHVYGWGRGTEYVKVGEWWKSPLLLRNPRFDLEIKARGYREVQP